MDLMHERHAGGAKKRTPYPVREDDDGEAAFVGEPIGEYGSNVQEQTATYGAKRGK